MAETDPPPVDPGVVVLAEGRDEESLADSVLLLSALGIPHALVQHGYELALVVAPEHAERARRELVGLPADHEAQAAPPALRAGSRAGVPTAIALVLGHLGLAALTPAKRAAIYAAGQVDSSRLHELYRVVTALTLHADPAHVVGNAVATAIFLSAAGDWVGPGLALLCTILAGAIGNLVAATIDPGHLSIGFSTATFGALGLTAVFGFVARYRDRLARRRAWLALGAGVALLAFLGAGEKSDLLAHITGLITGALLGAVVGRRSGTRAIELGPLGQSLAAIAAVGIVGIAWVLAFHR